MAVAARDKTLAEREVTSPVYSTRRVRRCFERGPTPIDWARWWGPKGFTNSVCEIDARVGGAIHIHMRSPDDCVCHSASVEAGGTG